MNYKQLSKINDSKSNIEVLQDIVGQIPYNYSKKRFVGEVYNFLKARGYSPVIVNDLYIELDGKEYQFSKTKDGYKVKPIETSKVKDSINLSVGDLYNDGNYSGKVTSISNDKITIESQNEDGDVVNIEIPIEDSKKHVSDILEDTSFLRGLAKEKNKSVKKLKEYINKERNAVNFYYNRSEVSWNELPLEVRKHDYSFNFYNGIDCYPFTAEDYHNIKQLIKDSKISDDINTHSITEDNYDELLKFGKTDIYFDADSYSAQDVQDDFELDLESRAEVGEYIPEVSVEEVEPGHLVLRVSDSKETFSKFAKSLLKDIKHKVRLSKDKDSKCYELIIGADDVEAARDAIEKIDDRYELLWEDEDAVETGDHSYYFKVEDSSNFAYQYYTSLKNQVQYPQAITDFLIENLPEDLVVNCLRDYKRKYINMNN